MLRFVLLILVLAAVIYAVFWVIDRRSRLDGGGSASPATPHGPVGPDDDEDFLRDLEWKRRRDEAHPSETDDGDGTPGT